METVQRVEEPRVTEFAAPAPQTASPPDGVTEAPPPPFRKRAAANWEGIVAADFDGVAFERLPPDTGIVAPIARAEDDPDPPIAGQLEQLAAALAEWKPGRAPDPVTRVRNLLLPAAVADVYRLDPLERFIPLLVFEQMQTIVGVDEQPKILYFIAVNPDDGEISAAWRLHELGLPDAPRDTGLVRNRMMIYAFKLLRRVVPTASHQ